MGEIRSAVGVAVLSASGNHRRAAQRAAAIERAVREALAAGVDANDAAAIAARIKEVTLWA